VLLATHLQESRSASRARRTLAAVACLWFVAGTLLAMRHEAQVAHVLDPHTGELHHATSLVGHHYGTQSDVHPCSDGPADDGPCAIAKALHQAVHHDASHIATPLLRLETRTECAPAHVTHIVASLYRFAPKTSPPLRA